MICVKYASVNSDSARVICMEAFHFPLSIWHNPDNSELPAGKMPIDSPMQRPAPWDAGLYVSRLYYASAGASTVTLCSCISFSAIRSSIVSLVRISSSTVMVS